MCFMSLSIYRSSQDTKTKIYEFICPFLRSEPIASYIDTPNARIVHTGKKVYY